MAEIKSVGVVGGGQMGSGIAQLAAVNGFDVWLHDSDKTALEKAFKSISGNIQRLIFRGKLNKEKGDDSLRRLKAALNLDDFHSVDIVIEAIVESEDVKKKLFANLDKIVKGSAILASNTSSISITRLASATNRSSQYEIGNLLLKWISEGDLGWFRDLDKFYHIKLCECLVPKWHDFFIPARYGTKAQFRTLELWDSVIGMHFMNPPPVMKLVEIVRGTGTSDDTFNSTKRLAERFGKTVICSQDFSGFIVNRILMPMINEAFHALYTGVATKEDIDTGMKLGTNHPMGPLELADFIGLDICLSIMRVLHAGLGDIKYAPCPLLVQYVDAGRLGRKRGMGVYSYSETTKEMKPLARL